MNWQNSEKKEDTTEIPKSWLYLHYYEALTTLFRIENALRLFVFVVLKNVGQEKWIDYSVVSDDAEKGTVNSIAKKRISQAKTFGYLSYTISCPIMHLTTGELIQLIDSHWKNFNEYFPGSKEIVKNKLDEIGAIRNAVAHFRPISNDDVGVIKQNANHVLRDVEECLNQITNFSQVVPSNTEAPWYKEIRVLGTKNCSLSFHYSRNEKWIRINILKLRLSYCFIKQIWR